MPPNSSSTCELEDAGDYRAALERLESAVASSPNAIDRRLEIARFFVRRGNPEAALEHLAFCVERSPDVVAYVAELGHVLIRCGRLESARKLLVAQRRNHPESIELQIGLAIIHQRRGALDRASRCLAPVMASPRPPLLAVECHVACLRQQARFDEALACIAATRGRDDLASRAVAALLHLESECRDRMGDYAGAFEAIRRANDMVAGPYDPDHHSREVRGLIDRYSSSRLMQATSAPARDRGIVLVVGMPRSGTTLVEQILASHSGVFARGEREELRVLAGEVGMRRPEELDAGSVTEMSEWLHRALESEEPSASTLVTNKLPENYLHLGLARLLAPQARVLHCRRDPRDTALSIYMQHFGENQPFAHRLSWIVRRYRDYRAIMSHWQSVSPLPILDIDYEALVDQPNSQIPRILEFCGLDFQSACLHPHRRHRDVATASHEQVRLPIHRGSVGRHRHYAPWLEELEELDGL